jgi:hypothetical protein
VLLYGIRQHQTVGVQYGHDILNTSNGGTISKAMPTHSNDTVSIVAKMLKLVLNSSHDGVPLK